jgi:hypothetical protein
VNRTPDLLCPRQAPSHSATPRLVGAAGFEPACSCFRRRLDKPLLYAPQNDIRLSKISLRPVGRSKDPEPVSGLEPQVSAFGGPRSILLSYTGANANQINPGMLRKPSAARKLRGIGPIPSPTGHSPSWSCSENNNAASTKLFLPFLERAARLELAASALGLRRSVPLSYARIRGVTGENRTLVDWVTASRLNHSATVTKHNSRKRCNTFAAR